MDDVKLKTITETIRQKYDGEMSLLEASGVEVIVAPPDRATFSRFRDQLLDDKKRGRAFEGLVKACLLYPSPAELDAQLERKPALVMTFAEKLSEMAGSGAVVEEKKL